jgi:hypothetical protein
MKIHYSIVLLAAAGVAAALYFQRTPQASEPAGQSQLARAERAPPRAHQSAGQLPVQSDEFKPIRPKSGQSRATAFERPARTELLTSAANPPDVQAELEARRAESEALMRAHLSAVAANHGSEARDQRWSNDVSASLQAALSTEELAGTDVQSIDCRTTTCRIELQDDGSGDLPAKLPMLAVQMAGSLPNMVAERIDQPDGQMTVVVYLSRPST